MRRTKTIEKHKRIVLISKSKRQSILDTTRRAYMANAAATKAFPLSTVSHLIWLDDVSVTCNEDKRKSMVSKLKVVFSNSNIRTFEDEIECEGYIIRCSSSDRVTLLAGEEKAKTILPRIYNFKQVVSVYVHRSEGMKEENWTDKRLKVSP